MSHEEIGDPVKYSNKDVAEAIITFNQELPWNERFERLMHEWSACQQPKSYWRKFISHLISSINDEKINQYLTLINSSFLKNSVEIYHLCVNASKQKSYTNNNELLLQHFNYNDLLHSLIFDNTTVVMDFDKIRLIILNKFPNLNENEQREMSLRLEAIMQVEFQKSFSQMKHDFPEVSDHICKEIAFSTLFGDNSQTSTDTYDINNYYGNNNSSTKQYQPQYNYYNYYNQYSFGDVGFSPILDNNSQQSGPTNPSTSGYVEVCCIILYLL